MRTNKRIGLAGRIDGTCAQEVRTSEKVPGDIFHDDACFEQLLTLTNCCRALQLVAATAAATAAAAIVVVAGV